MEGSKGGGGLFGKIALHHKLLTPAQLEECLVIQGWMEGQKPLGVIAVEKGYLTEAQVKGVL